MPSRHRSSSILVAASFALAVACKQSSPGGEPPAATAPPAAATSAPPPAPPPKAAPTPADILPSAAVTEADRLYNLRCLPCHGATGKGDGPAGLSSDPRPADYTSAAWQDRVTDEEIEKAIVGGGPAVGRSNMMPPQPDLADKPDVVKALRQKLRRFGGR